MKHILFLFLFTLYIVAGQAQNVPAQGSYITNNTMGAFHGTWQWVSGIDTVKMYLITKKIHSTMNDGFDWDCLVGWHIYKRGNVIIESNYAGINNIGMYSINCGNAVTDPNTRKVDGILKDLTKNKQGELTLTLNATGNQLIWKLEVCQGAFIYVAPQTAPPPGFTLPTNMVFTKQ